MALSPSSIAYQLGDPEQIILSSFALQFSPLLKWLLLLSHFSRVQLCVTP